MKTIIYLIIITTILALSYICYSNGNSYYTTREKNNKITQKVYDIGHRYLPDRSHNNLYHILVNIVVFSPLIIYFSIIGDFISYIIPIMLFRSITSNVTILPKTKNCDSSEFRIFNFFHGHCYDKIFSGHFASSILISLLLYSKGLVQNIPILILYNMISAYLILVTRHHYTVDVLMAGYISVTMFILGINMDFIEKI